MTLPLDAAGSVAEATWGRRRPVIMLTPNRAMPTTASRAMAATA